MRVLEPGRGRPRRRPTIISLLWAVATVLACVVAAGLLWRLF